MLARLLCLLVLCIGLAVGCAKPADTPQIDPGPEIGAVQDLPTVELPASITGDVSCVDMTDCVDPPTLALTDGDRLALVVQPIDCDAPYVMTDDAQTYQVRRLHQRSNAEACTSARDSLDASTIVRLFQPVPIPRC